MIPPLTAFFNECTFITLPIIAFILFRVIKNRHVIASSKRRRSRYHRRRANSHESRANPLSEFIAEANSDLQVRSNSYDKTRESTFGKEDQLNVIADDESVS